MDRNILDNKITVVVILMGCLMNQEVFSQREKQELYLANLDSHCLTCLCYAASNCNITLGCERGYCGAYKISRIYWVDAGKPTLEEDNPEREGAYEDCALSYQCAQRIIKGYLSKFAKDCNGDGVTDCEDFAMINFNGAYHCSQPLDRNEVGRRWQTRFRTCDPTGPLDDD